MSTTQVVSATPAANFAINTGGVVDTGGKFVTGVNDTSSKFANGLNDAGRKFAAGVNNTDGK